MKKMILVIIKIRFRKKNIFFYGFLKIDIIYINSSNNFMGRI